MPPAPLSAPFSLFWALCPSPGVWFSSVERSGEENRQASILPSARVDRCRADYWSSTEELPLERPGHVIQQRDFAILLQLHSDRKQ